MLTALVVVFIVAYAAIALEHPLKINKSASALVGAGCCGPSTRWPPAITIWSASSSANR
jgi:uncharacterized membrane protein YadS